MDDSGLYVTLAAALAAAGIGALGASLLRQSVILGYLVAGMAIGPHTPGFVADIPTVEDLADIGVVLLMFAIGLQLSFRDVRRVGGIALLGGGAQVVITLGAVTGLGMLAGLGWLPALFLGAVVSNSSSTVLSKVLADRGEIESLHARVALAWSTVQDFSTIILVVILTVLAEDGSTASLAGDLLRAVGLAVLYLAIVIPAGFVLLPRFFDLVARLGSTEVFTLSAVVVALGISLLAQLFGVSIALGAFVGGILVNRSDLSHEVLGQLNPLRDIFAGLFFVSVGMLIDPRVLLDAPALLLLSVAAIVVLKGWLSVGITLAFRYPGRTAVLTGAVLAQSAEFSFLLARLGTDTGAISSELFGVMLAAAAASMVLSPAVLAAADPLGRALDRRLRGRARPPGEAPDPGLANHAILAGYGRVGRVVHRAIRDQAIPVVVIEQDAETVAALRRDGVTVFQGSASNPVLLERAGIRTARALVVAIPDPLSARRIVTFARGANPAIDIVVRTHSESERAFLEEHGADEAVLGELELALEMSRHTLKAFRVAEPAVAAILARMRSRAG
ncbi:cation:proton antiporter [Tepidiforma flava]|uniref:Cation:proton antiporter n=1 Tax=Tepidiforma flava TaxID=3004094 RepID=A0ABY7MAS4_9CHLR|nr:cation:proton antiporter [Tepidiforma flava]